MEETRRDSRVVVGEEEENDDQEEQEQGRTLLPEKHAGKWPPSIKYIMGNEACERFSFYGLKAILALYLKNFLHLSEDTATTVIHTFIFGAYGSSVLGGYIADSFLGKFRTILYISFVYCLGSITLACTALPGATGDPPHWWGAALGLLLVAIGTGGIKASVSSFVGDQFPPGPGQEALLTTVFSIFYFCINMGSLSSTLITPLLREYTTYSIAFGVPAVLLLFATVIFWLGKPTYRIVPPGPNVINVTFGVVGRAIAEKYRSFRRRYSVMGDEEQAVGRKRFLDYAYPIYPQQTIQDVRDVLQVFKVFLPLPIFWSLYDQHSSRWIFQAEQMDRYLGFDFEIQPDQVPTLNPLLILLLIPIFNKGVYPGLEKIGLKLKPLARMSIGMFLASLSFVVSGLVELAIEKKMDVFIAWQLPQYFLLCCGEILVSITGLEFAYSQAPKTMKSVVMAGWLLTTAIGNAIVAGVAEVKIFESQAWEFFFYAGLMIVFLGLFLLVAWTYTYVSVAEEEGASPRAEGVVTRHQEEEARPDCSNSAQTEDREDPLLVPARRKKKQGGGYQEL
ncbi:Peptide transporter family 1 [Balamuthia mandrillaris]